MYHDDFFASTRMPFGDHLEELRRHLGRAVAGLVLALALVLGLDLLGYATGTTVGVARPVKDFISRPVEDELEQFHERRLHRIEERLRTGEARALAANALTDVPVEVDCRRLAERLGLETRKDGPLFAAVPARIPPLTWALLLEHAERQVRRRAGLTTLSLSEAMVVYFQVALACALLLASPWVFWQLWSFVAAGLYPHERRPVYLFLPVSLLLFLAGVGVCQLVVMPRAVAALLWFNDWLDLEPDLRLREWLGFAVLLPLVFGLAFQTPLAMLAVGRLGIVTAAEFRAKRRHAWFGLAVFAAVITPSADATGLMALWVSVSLLYELGILLCAWASRGKEIGESMALVEQSGADLQEPAVFP